MYKDIVISLLGAWILRDVFGTTEVGEQIAIVMGLAAMLFIFAFFVRFGPKNGRNTTKEYRIWSRDWSS